jgi:NitT/TauT family transport system substrate-binding protein
MKLGRVLRVSTATAGAAGLLLLAGCFSSSGTFASGGGTTITVSAEPGLADAPLYLGIKDGLFRGAGIHLVVRSYPTVKQEVAHLAKGTTDIAFGDYADVFYTSQLPKTEHLSIVADGYDCAPNMLQILTLPQDNISSPADLKGMSIGVPEPDVMSEGSPRAPVPYSEEELAAWGVLQNNGVDPIHVHWVASPPGLSLLNALLAGPANGGVAAIVATEPDIYTAEQQLGAVPLLDICGGSASNTGLPLDGYFTTQNFAASHPAALTAFRSALEQAQADATSDTSSVDSYLTQDVSIDPMTAALVSAGTYPTTTSANNLQRVADQMFFYSVAPPGQTTALDVSSLVFR